jgi:hypothetical protein
MENRIPTCSFALRSVGDSPDSPRHLTASQEVERRSAAAVTRDFAKDVSALGGIRTPNLLIRSQMLYPLSYERWWEKRV